MTTLVTIAGALRQASTNRLLAAEAARLFAPDELIQADLRFPLYDGDLEEAEGVPDAVQTLADQIAGADAVVISTPEYNKALSGVLKNALDWISRTKGRPFAGKPTAIMSAAAGRAGGERSQFSLRLCLVPFGADVLTGPEVMIANSGNAFDDTGRLKDENAVKFLGQLMENLRARI
ncbi:NADPH-dependent FMN reductase [Aestuariibius sp. 2305UL40-4]|uniref:NADPH-dependent FMN reductase n=1 Tax=Aestuariibius violaceus TaxID=3234132 RepID=UPI00345EE281